MIGSIIFYGKKLTCHEHRQFKGGLGGTDPPAKNYIVENLDEMLTYVLALLNQVF